MAADEPRTESALVAVPALSQGQPEPLGVLGVTRILLRWSPLIIPLIALSLYLSLSLTSSIQPEFTAQASMLLTGPNELQYTDPTTGELLIEDINPLNELGGSLPTVAQVTAVSLTDSETLSELEARGFAIVFNVWNESRSPIINAEAIDSDADIAADTVVYLLGLVESDLQARQDALEAPDALRITAQPIDEVSVSEPDFSGKTRTRIGLAVVGVAFSIALAFVFEGVRQLVSRSRARREQLSESEASGLQFAVAGTDRRLLDDDPPDDVESR